MDPAAGISLFGTIAEATKKIAEVARAIKDHEAKGKLNDVYDTLISLKQNAAKLEDENRELKEKLRLKSDEFEFRNPFYYERRYADRPLCPKCFVESERIAPMETPYRATGWYRQCLVCGKTFKVSD